MQFKALEASKEAAQLMAEKNVSIRKINSINEFNDIISQKEPLVIKCSSDHCPPCKMVKPHYVKAAAELGDTITFAELDLAKVPVMQQLNIKMIPAFVLYRDGKQVTMFAGFKEKAALVEEFKKLIS